MYMKKYCITIEELLSKDFEIMAHSKEEAIKFVEQRYRKVYNETYILTADDFVCTHISAEDELSISSIIDNLF